MKHTILGIAAGAAIITSAMHISVYAQDSGMFGRASVASLVSSAGGQGGGQNEAEVAASTEARKLSESEIYTIIRNLKKEIVPDVRIVGDVEVIQIDDFEHEEKSRVEYFLRTDDERLKLNVVDGFSFAPNKTYAVTGKRVGNSVIAQSQDIEPVIPGANTSFCPDEFCSPESGSEAVGEQKTLVLLVNFQNSGRPPISPEKIHDLIFNKKINSFYKEQSYGKTYFTGDVFGWLTLPRNSSGQFPDIYGADVSRIESYIEENGIDPSEYSRLLLISDSLSGGMGTIGKTTVPLNGEEYSLSVGWVGLYASSIFNTSHPDGHAAVSDPYVFSKFDYATAHELGHNLGAMHANGLDCGQNIVTGTCGHVEYGNSFDAMGMGHHALHFSALNKELLGWVPTQNKVVIKESGRYTINTLETPIVAGGQNVAKNFAKIQMYNSNHMPLYVEYRKGVGFDSGLNARNVISNQSGLFVDRLVPTYDGLPFSRLLDIVPTTQTWYNDIMRSALGGAGVFKDLEKGITIGPVTNVSTSTITFDVKIDKPQCTRANPLLGSASYFAMLVPGQEVQTTVNFGNGDSVGCYDSRFSVTTDGLPEEWNPTITPPENIVISPTEYRQVEASKEIRFTIPEETPDSLYNFTIRVNNISSGRSSTVNGQVYVVNPPVILGVTPTSGPVETGVTITGSNIAPEPVVMVTNNVGYEFIGETSDGSVVGFEFPSSMNEFECTTTDCRISTTPGTYDIRVYGNGVYSDPVSFEVTE